LAGQARLEHVRRDVVEDPLVRDPRVLLDELHTGTALTEDRRDLAVNVGDRRVSVGVLLACPALPCDSLALCCYVGGQS
jgi:hypothetical protein